MILRKSGIISSGSSDSTTTIYGAGLGNSGVFGNGYIGSYLTFEPLIEGNFDHISSQGLNTCYLSQGDLYVTGSNYYGQLGLGLNVSNTLNLLKVPGKWTYAVYGNSSLYALSGTDLYVAGNNTDGQLGIGTNNNINILTKVTGQWDMIYPSAFNYNPGGFCYAKRLNILYAVGSNY